MLRYPIWISFCARSEKRWPGYNQVGTALEKYINDVMASEPTNAVRSFFYPQLARELGLALSLVERVLYAADCGSHGITIVKGDIDRALDRSTT